MESILTDEEIESWRTELEQETNRIISDINTNSDLSQTRASVCRSPACSKLRLSSIKEVSAALADVAGDTKSSQMSVSGKQVWILYSET